MDKTQAERGRLLTPGEVAMLFRVDPKTVTRWAAAGRISSIRTPGGHRRFRESEVRALLEGGPTSTTSSQIPAQAPVAVAVAVAAQIPAQVVAPNKAPATTL
jgi:excisionase family DNA binding protein